MSSAGFPAIDRNHYLATSDVQGKETGYPAVLMEPPPGTPAAITKEAMVKAFKLYVKLSDTMSVIVLILNHQFPNFTGGLLVFFK